MKTITILLLICSMSIKAQTFSISDNTMNGILGRPIGTPFEPSDYGHFNVGNKFYLVTALTLNVEIFDSLTLGGKILRGFGATAGVIFIKEGYDKLDPKHVASWKDTGIGLIGAVSGVVVHVVAVYAMKAFWALTSESFKINHSPKYRNHIDNFKRELDFERNVSSNNNRKYTRIARLMKRMSKNSSKIKKFQTKLK